VGTSSARTRGVRVDVESFFVPERSDPDSEQWFFAYRVTITNEGGEPVQLISRHWVITNGDGEEQEVRGPGVVGAQPRLGEGESFQYTSACPLGTPVGTMHGTYRMVDDEGEGFDAEIAPFGLSEPRALN
jgi:ApaG protein